MPLNRRGGKKAKPVQRAPGRTKADARTPQQRQQFKLRLALAIMVPGMALAMVWASVAGWGMDLKYPYSTFLFLPDNRYHDLIDVIAYASCPNPYDDPYQFYLPFGCLALRGLVGVPYYISIIGVLAVTMAGLVVLTTMVLRKVAANHWLLVLFVFLGFATSYPIVSCLDRANVEILVVLLVASALYLFGQRKMEWGMVYLIPAICIKAYPLVFLTFLLRQRRVRLLLTSVAGVVVITVVSTWCLPLSLGEALASYQRNMTFFTYINVYENTSLEGAASLWNLYKVIVMTAVELGFAAPMDYAQTNPFIVDSYTIYSFGMLLLMALIAIYVCLIEKEFLRCALIFSLFLAIGVPSGADYRLLHAGVALILIILLKTRRRHDTLILVLLALTMVPKKEIFLTYLGSTETGYADVSMQVVLNPIFVLTAIVLVLHDGWKNYDRKWTRLRFRRIVRSLWFWQRPPRPAVATRPA